MFDGKERGGLEAAGGVSTRNFQGANWSTVFNPEMVELAELFRNCLFGEEGNGRVKGSPEVSKGSFTISL